MNDNTNATAVLTNETQFAPAKRSDIHQLRELNATIESTPHIITLIDAMPFVVLILNRNRQIVAANHKVFSLLGIGIEDALGKRPGELIGCIHAASGPNGCGTGIHCKVCGAVNAIIDTVNTSDKVTEECIITLQDDSALNWEITTSPLEIEGHSLICMGVRDISHQKRRNSLERTFFHDIVNHLGAISGFVKMLAEEYPENEEINEVMILADELLEEIQSQRELTLAENGDLVLNIQPFEMEPFLHRLCQLYQQHPVAKNRTIVVAADGNTWVDSDANMLRRVVGNMIKNALEACGDGQTVTLSCKHDARAVSVSVQNPTVMPEDIQLQVFKRSFSTKATSGRGIGTYSMKLLGEKYLKGHVTFSSDPDNGTIFTISLPL